VRGQFLLDYIDLLLQEGEGEAEGFRHVAANDTESNPSRKERTARGRERWVINKLRALGSWYTKGVDNGSRLRTAINQCDSIDALRDLVRTFFFESDMLGQPAIRWAAPAKDAGAPAASSGA
jgi:hypothetical protein